MDYIGTLAKVVDKKSEMNPLPPQPNDVPDTYANVDNLVEQFDCKPATPVEQGAANFIQWYRECFKV